MEKAKDKIQKIFELVGFEDLRVEISDEQERIIVSIRDKVVPSGKAPELVDSLTHLARQIAKKEGVHHVLVDVNDYRKEREALLAKLARAAAKKAAVTGEQVSLPAMNAYERMVVHTELSMRPDVDTESEGEGSDRHVVVKVIDL